ncbi:hypothetical protein ACFLRQ_00560 [Bacteroidota bacterium]
MKKIISLLLFAIFLVPLYSQDEELKAVEKVKDASQKKEHRTNNSREYKTLFDPNAGSGGYGAISLGYTQIDGRNGLLMGGRGEWIIGHGLGLGVGGYGFINDPKFNNIDNLYYNLTGGYGGFIMEPIIMGRWPVHISFPILIGAGGVALTSYSEDIFTVIEDYDAYFNEASAFFVAEPGVELELNLVRWMRLAFFGNYRYTTKLISTGTINENALNGWSTGITLKLGKF